MKKGGPLNRPHQHVRITASDEIDLIGDCRHIDSVDPHNITITKVEPVGIGLKAVYHLLRGETAAPKVFVKEQSVDALEVADAVEVRPVAENKRVCAGVPNEEVISVPAVEPVVAPTSEQFVRATAAKEAIAEETPIECVIAQLAEKPVAARATRDVVSTVATE